MPLNFVEGRYKVRPSGNSLPGTTALGEADGRETDADVSAHIQAYAVRCLRRSIEFLKRGDPKKAFEEASLAHVMAEGVDQKLFDAARMVMRRAGCELEASQSRQPQES